MPQTSAFADNVVAYKILRMLVTPFEKTDAYKLGIIDETGKPLKKFRDLKTSKEKEAYTFLHRIVFRLKRIINMLPTQNKQFASYAAAYALVKECTESNIEPVNLESIFLEALEYEYDTTLVEEFFRNDTMKTFKLFLEDSGGASSGPVSGVPANTATVTPGISGIGRTPDDVAVPPRHKRSMKYFKRKKIIQ
jgi:hypothetical protein